LKYSLVYPVAVKFLKMGNLSAITVPRTSGLYQLASYMTGRFHWKILVQWRKTLKL